MQINIDGRSVTRVLAVAAATIGVGAAAFFGGQSMRMDDTAVASVKTEAVEKAVTAAKAEDAIVLTDKLAAAKTHEKRAVRKTRRTTRRNERRRAKRIADKAQQEGYASGNSAGYSSGNAAGHAAGKEEGYEEGSADGYSDGSADSFDFCEEDDGTIC